jgi:hypothetical protein
MGSVLHPYRPGIPTSDWSQPNPPKPPQIRNSESRRFQLRVQFVGDRDDVEQELSDIEKKEDC